MRFFIIISFFFLSISSVISEENIENAIESNEIEYFNETGELKALGSVKITRESFQLEADEVIFNQKNNIIEGIGNVVIKEKDGSTILASKFKLSSDLSDGIIEMPTLLTKEGVNISSAYAIRNGSKSIVLKKGIFSPNLNFQ